MKIGILTYHRSHNYGALLQAIALRKVLADMGHEVTFIDYWPDYHRHMYKFFSWKVLQNGDNISNSIKYLKNLLLFPFSRKERINNFNSFIEKNIAPYISSMNDCYDIVVHGSDQIWRKQPEIHAYNPIYFGVHQIKTKCRISYAASMGILPNSNADRQILKSYLSHLDGISAREGELRELVNELGYNCRQDIDPTLLLTGSDWKNYFHISVKPSNTARYVLYYKLQSDSFDLRKIAEFASSRGLKLKILNSSASRPKSDRNITTANPEQFLELVYNADFVFTSSFHGLVFSILFHKEFLASFSNNSGRAAFLLSKLNLSQRLLLPKSDICQNLIPINYEAVEGCLQSYRQNSWNYLNQLIVK